jgi:hypothetical protein
MSLTPELFDEDDAISEDKEDYDDEILAPASKSRRSSSTANSRRAPLSRR